MRIQLLNINYRRLSTSINIDINIDISLKYNRVSNYMKELKRVWQLVSTNPNKNSLSPYTVDTFLYPMAIVGWITSTFTA